MIDDLIRFVGGPKDGQVVRPAPNYLPIRADEREVETLPRCIKIKPFGQYEFNSETKRYEWVS